MAKRRVHSKATTQELPCLPFTPDQLVVLHKAVTLFEQRLLAHEQSLPNRDFALVTIRQVQEKINYMMQHGICGETVTLDANEVLILQAANWILAIALEAAEPSPQNELLKAHCHAITSLLAPLTKQRG